MTEGNSYRNQTMSVASIDLMKLICSFMVVVIHYKPLLPYSTFLNVLTAEGICRIAVPFFFTVSGMLLCAKLSEQKISAENQRMICRKALESNIKLYLYWTAIYWVYYIPQWYINEAITWSNLINQLRQALIDTGSCYHFWYMVSLIYAIPLMRRLSECSTKTLVRLVLVLWPVQCLRYSYRWLPGGGRLAVGFHVL